MGVKLGLTMRKGRGLRAFENRVFKKTLGSRRKQERLENWELQGRSKMHKEFWWGNLKDTDHLEKSTRGLKDNIK
jgi:hypothetical protein